MPFRHLGTQTRSMRWGFATRRFAPDTRTRPCHVFASLKKGFPSMEPDPADDFEKLALVHKLIEKFELRLSECEANAEWSSSDAVVWHYSSGPNARNIIAPADKPAALWACSSEFMNDEHDGRWLGYNLSLRTADNLLGDLLTAPKIGLFATCLTFDLDSESHWCRYGDGHRGVALGFRVSRLQAAAKNVHPPRFIRVLYTSERDPLFDDVAQMMTDLKAAVFSLSNHVAGTKRGFWRGTQQLVAKYEWYFKDSHYQSETEMRIAFEHPEASGFHGKNGEHRPYLELPLEGALEEIILGSRCGMTEIEIWRLAGPKNPNLRSVRRSTKTPKRPESHAVQSTMNSAT
jgi:hypothetical protein